MTRARSVWGVAAAAMLSAGWPAQAVAQSSPLSPATVDVPAFRTSDLTPPTALPRESAIENALGRTTISSSSFGGYGELTLNAPTNGTSVVDLRRLVLYFGHDFNERLRFYSELEAEHAIASSGDRGEFEIEQAYLDALFTRRLNLRGGLVLMPMGIVNVYHEPPSYNGVNRPDVDLRIIPSTWREPGVGIFGELAEGLRYQLYAVNGFNANGFTAQSGVRAGHQEGQLAFAGDFGAIARLDYEFMLGAVLGASVYGATSGNSLTSAVGRVPVGLLEADARFRKGPLTGRVEFAVVLVGGAAGLNQALLAGTASQQAAGPVASRGLGAYGELGYDLLSLVAAGSEQSLTAFARIEFADTQAAVPAGLRPKAEFRVTSPVVGLVYRPIPQVALKADFRRRWLGSGTVANEFASALTWLF